MAYNIHRHTSSVDSPGLGGKHIAGQLPACNIETVVVCCYCILQGSSRPVYSGPIHEDHQIPEPMCAAKYIFDSPLTPR